MRRIISLIFGLLTGAIVLVAANSTSLTNSTMNAAGNIAGHN